MHHLNQIGKTVLVTRYVAFHLKCLTQSEIVLLLLLAGFVEVLLVVVESQSHHQQTVGREDNSVSFLMTHSVNSRRACDYKVNKMIEK